MFNDNGIQSIVIAHILSLSPQVPFVGFQPIRTSEHMAAAGRSVYIFTLIHRRIFF